MSVHFIGAGPGAPDLITVRGLKLIKAAGVVLYAGSLVPEAIVAEASSDARVVDTAPLHLDEIIDEIKAADDNGLDVARVHSGDPSLYGAVAEQMRRLDVLGIDYDVTPGVSAYAAAAAATDAHRSQSAAARACSASAVRSSSSPGCPRASSAPSPSAWSCTRRSSRAAAAGVSTAQTLEAAGGIGLHLCAGAHEPRSPAHGSSPSAVRP